MLKNIVVNLLKLVAGLIYFIATILLAAFVSSNVMKYCLDNDMQGSTAYLFGMCSLILVGGLVFGITAIVHWELCGHEEDVKN